LLDRWIPDADWVQSFRNKSGYSRVTPGELNLSISQTVDNKYKDPITGWTIFNNKRRKVITNTKNKTKKKICFYYVVSIIIEMKGLIPQQKQSSGKPFGMTQKEVPKC
jgi:hypothetical protein